MGSHDFPHACVRCGAELRVSSMSRFNTDICCLACLSDEEQAPGYRAAVEAERAAVRAGDLNFPGVGLGAADRAFLKARLDARAKGG